MNTKHAREIYEQIKNRLKSSEGKIVAIEPQSGDFFIGADTMEAYEKGHQKYPDKEFYFKRIGARATYFVGCV